VKSDDAKVRANGSWTLTPAGDNTVLALDFTIEASGFQGIHDESLRERRA
jgi:hypothetical protein